MRCCLLNRTNLFLWIAFIFLPFAYAEPVCTLQWGKLAIGTAGQNPFTADVQITSWQISAEGTKRQVGPLFLFHVARDGSERVAIKGPLIYGETGVPYVPGGPKSVEKLEWAQWQIVLCDPLTDTTATFWQFLPTENQPAKKSANVISGGSIPGLNRRGFIIRDRMGRDVRWIDLGHKELQGVDVHGYRWWPEKNPYGDFVEGNFTEQWISEALATELVMVKTEQAHNREERTELINVRRVEADPSLFHIPRGYEVVDPKKPNAHDDPWVSGWSPR